MKEIKLTKGYVALVDDEEFARCMVGTKWYARVDKCKDGSVTSVYARRSIHTADGTPTKQLLHRFILGIINPKAKVDHEDHNGLNNQRYNLRLANDEENTRNQRMRSDNTSGVKGVSWFQSKWRARITVDGKSKFLGNFSDKEDAKHAYDTAALKLHGRFAYTNAMMAQEAA